MDKTLVMDNLFRLMREFPEFKGVSNIQYDEKYDLVRVQIGVAEKVIPINDKSSGLAIVLEVMNWFARE